MLSTPVVHTTKSLNQFRFRSRNHSAGTLQFRVQDDLCVNFFAEIYGNPTFEVMKDDEASWLMRLTGYMWLTLAQTVCRIVE